MATPATHPKTTVKAAAGGSFLLEERTPQDVFTPEDFTEEQRQIAEDGHELCAEGNSAGGR